MRSILVLTCCLALASVAAADQNKHNKKQGNQVQGQQVQQQAVIKPGKHGLGAGNARLNAQGNAGSQFQTKSQLRMQQRLAKTQGGNLPGSQSSNMQITRNKNFTKTNVKNFNISKQTNVNITKVNFRPGVHIQGSHKWIGPRYVVFRSYTPLWHDRIWWISNHPRIVLIGGGYYYWDAGWWYPAWGYEPTATFVYDGPIYAYHDLDPGQVVANVQSALQEQGYYEGEVDGLLGPLTRAALAKYQADHGLYETAAIDEPTMESLGFA